MLTKKFMDIVKKNLNMSTGKKSYIIVVILFYKFISP